MVTHTMRLYAEGFDMIKDGMKTVEVRLNDEKRQQVKPGHYIRFIKLPLAEESIMAQVTNITVYPSFAALYQAVPFSKMGRADKSQQWMMDASYSYYTPEQEQHYGVMAIEFELIK